MTDVEKEDFDEEWLSLYGEMFSSWLSAWLEVGIENKEKYKTTPPETREQACSNSSPSRDTKLR